MFRMRWPRRPEVKSNAARTILEWTDTVAYVFLVVLFLAFALMALVHGWELADMATRLALEVKSFLS